MSDLPTRRRPLPPRDRLACCLGVKPRQVPSLLSPKASPRTGLGLRARDSLTTSCPTPCSCDAPPQRSAPRGTGSLAPSGRRFDFSAIDPCRDGRRMLKLGGSERRSELKVATCVQEHSDWAAYRGRDGRARYRQPEWVHARESGRSDHRIGVIVRGSDPVRRWPKDWRWDDLAGLCTGDEGNAFRCR
jgi:hypothetical protein